eukprot:COSAG06_NODE_1173_length_10423_cov_4.361100_6_plen_1107_part_00
MSQFRLGPGRLLPLIAANKALSLDSDSWSFGFTAAGGAPSGEPPLGTATVPGTMEAQGYGQPSRNMRHSNGQTCSYGCLNQSNYRLPSHPFANFSRTFAVPTDWTQLAGAAPPNSSFEVVLRVERVHRIGQVFVDGRRLANVPNYLVPTEVTLPAAVLAGGVHRLDIVVDSWYDPAKNNYFSAADMLDVSVLDGIANGTFSYTGVSGHVDLLFRQTAAALVSASLQITPIRNATTKAWSVEVRVEATGNASTVDFAVFDSATPCLQVASTTARVVGGAAEASIELDCKSGGCSPWSPDSPALYTMVASLAGGNQQISRFGLRILRIEGGTFFLNDAPLFLRGYGDDATDYVYSGLPTAPGPSVTVDAYRKKLRLAKMLGFNFFRPHSQVVTPEYAWASAEEGMLLSVELPIANYVRFSTDNDRKLIPEGLNATIKNYRNIPSVFVYTIANEIFGDYKGKVGAAVAALKPLHGYCKALQNVSFCIDCDGEDGRLADINPETRQSTLPNDDFLSLAFDGGSCFDELRGKPPDGQCNGRYNAAPYGSAAHRSFPVPVIVHEANNFDSFPRYTSLIAATNKTAVIPTWVESVRDSLDASGLSSEESIFAHASEQLFFQITKSQVEYMRKADAALLAGYELWLLQDWWGIYNGFLTQDLRMKPGLSNVSAIKEFNAAIVITESALCCGSQLQSQPTNNSWLNTTLNINSFSSSPPSDCTGSTLQWQVVVGQQGLVCSGQRKLDSIPQGAITFGANVSCALPTLFQASAPQPVELRTQLMRSCGDGITVATATNSWRDYLTLHPPYVSSATAPYQVYSALDLGVCPYSNCKPLPADGRVPKGAVVLASNSRLSTAAVAVAKAGTAALVLVAGAAGSWSDASSWTCPSQFPWPDKKLVGICFNESALATAGGGPCGSWCTVCAESGTGCGRPLCANASKFGGCPAPANITSIPVEANGFGMGEWSYGTPDNTGTVVNAEASDAIFAGSVSPNAPLLAAHAKQVRGVALLIDNLTEIAGIPVVANRSPVVLVRALDAATPKFYGSTAPNPFRQKALLLRAELASGAVVVASGLNVVQQLVPAPAAAAGQAVDPQSAWLLRKMLTYASKLVAAQP